MIVTTPLGHVPQPLIIAQAIDIQERRQWWKHIQTRSKNEIVQVRRGTKVYDQELIDALELLQLAVEPVHVTSLGSSCSMDQLPNYDFCESLFEDPDVLSCFSEYTPMHDTLELSCHGAVSTLSSRAYTSIVITLGGGELEWRLEPQTTESLKAHDASSAVTRTWNGQDFSWGWNSRERLEPHTADMTVLAITTTPGDVLIIPNNWWFQSCAVGPANISVHSKRCGSKDLPKLIQHILGGGAAGDPTSASSSSSSAGDPQEMVHELFERIESSW
jgi:hypothetical protein